MEKNSVYKFSVVIILLAPFQTSTQENTADYSILKGGSSALTEQACLAENCTDQDFVCDVSATTTVSDLTAAAGNIDVSELNMCKC